MAGFDGFDSVGFANALSAAIASDSDTSVEAKVGIGWDAVRRRRLTDLRIPLLLSPGGSIPHVPPRLPPIVLAGLR
jgi:hypothetical protein